MKKIILFSTMQDEGEIEVSDLKKRSLISLVVCSLFSLIIVSPVKAITYIDSCQTLNTANETYLLISDIINSPNVTCMNIQNNNITLNCQNHLIAGNNVTSSYGIWVGGSNNYIGNCNITNYTVGIAVREYNNIIDYCKVYGGNSVGLDIDSDSIDSGNLTINNSFFKNSGWWGVGVRAVSNTKILNTMISYSSQGINLYRTTNTVFLSNLTLFKNYIGVQFDAIYGTPNNTVVQNSVIGNSSIAVSYGGPASEGGITVNLSFINNTIENSTRAFVFYTVAGWKIYNNRFKNNDWAIWTYWGWSGSRFLAYNNLFNQTSYFENNGYSGINQWNTTTGGNFWTNSTGNGYSDTCVNENADDFCDVPYTILGDNIDYLPLTTPPTPQFCIGLNYSQRNPFVKNNCTDAYGFYEDSCFSPPELPAQVVDVFCYYYDGSVECASVGYECPNCVDGVCVLANYTTLTIQTNNAPCGVFVPSLGSHVYPSNQNVTVTVYPTCPFLRWQLNNGTNITAHSFILKMNDNYNATCYFNITGIPEQQPPEVGGGHLLPIDFAWLNPSIAGYMILGIFNISIAGFTAYLTKSAEIGIGVFLLFFLVFLYGGFYPAILWALVIFIVSAIVTIYMAKIVTGG
jgi:hypothetical protein